MSLAEGWGSSAPPRSWWSVNWCDLVQATRAFGNSVVFRKHCLAADLTALWIVHLSILFLPCYLSFLDRASDVDVPCISEPSLNTWFLNFDQLWVSLLVAVHYTKMLSLWGLKAALIYGSRDRYLEGNRSRLTFRASELSSCVFLARLTVTAMSFFLWSGPESTWLSPIIFVPLLSPWTYLAKPVIIGAQSKNHSWVRLWNHHFKNLTHT